MLSGTTALAVSHDDPVAPARVINDFAKKLKDKFEIKGGYMDGKVMPLEEVQALANIPALPVLQAQALGTMLATITGLAACSEADRRKGRRSRTCCRGSCSRGCAR